MANPTPTRPPEHPSNKILCEHCREPMTKKGWPWNRTYKCERFRCFVDRNIHLPHPPNPNTPVYRIIEQGGKFYIQRLIHNPMIIAKRIHVTKEWQYLDSQGRATADSRKSFPTLGKAKKKVNRLKSPIIIHEIG